MLWLLELGCLLLLQGFRPLCCDVVAQKLHRRNSKQTLLCIEYPPCLLEPLQDCPQVLMVWLLVWTGYQDIVQVDKHIVQACQDLVHQPLECLARIS